MAVKETKRIGVNLDVELVNAVQAAATLWGMSLTSIVGEALIEWGQRKYVKAVDLLGELKQGKIKSEGVKEVRMFNEKVKQVHEPFNDMLNEMVGFHEGGE